jgi:thiamine biosynthesis lipoprotein
VSVPGAAPEHAALALGAGDRLERIWSRFIPESEISRANAAPGESVEVSPETIELVERAVEAWELTGGLFDPTIQPLWLARATRQEEAPARALLGWERVRVSAKEIALEPGMQLTFNGIPQSHAADAVARCCRSRVSPTFSSTRAKSRGWAISRMDRRGAPPLRCRMAAKWAAPRCRMQHLPSPRP